MQYKGDDLDLRVPPARAGRDGWGLHDNEPAFAGRWQRSGPMPTPPHGETLWVDETVLACCNYAFDIALANGAAEVGLEHLVNAMTRVEAASRVLEARGVREGQLRRDSAALIASEVPASGDRGAPRRSADLEDVLRRAAEVGARRGGPAGVDEVLWVLMTSPREVPAVALLRRLAPDWQRSDWSRPRDITLGVVETRAPVPAPIVPTYQMDALSTRLGLLEDGLRTLHGELAGDRKIIADMVRDLQRDVVAQRGDAASFRTDLGQRLEGLERGVQAAGEPTRLASQLAARLDGIDRSVTGLAEAQRGPADLGRRLDGIERALAGLQQPQRAAPELVQRLEAIERGLAAQASTPRIPAELAQRLEAIERAVAAQAGASRLPAELVQRLEAIEHAVASHGTAVARAPAEITERMHTLEKAVHGGLGEGARNWSALNQRLQAFEHALAEVRRQPANDGLGDKIGQITQLLEATAGEGGRHWNQLSERLGQIESRLMERQAHPAEGEAFLERHTGLERAVRSGFGENVRLISELATRLEGLEQTVVARPASDSSDGVLILDERMHGLVERIGGIERQLEEQLRVQQRAQGDLVERMIELSGSLSAIPSAADPGQIAASLVPHIGDIAQRLDSVSAEGQSRVTALRTAIDESVARVSDRVISLENVVRGDTQGLGEAMRAHDRELDALHDALARLAGTQTTLASAVADWRHDAGLSLGEIKAQLSRLLPQPAPAGVVAAAAAPAETATVDVAAPGATVTAASTSAEERVKDLGADDFEFTPSGTAPLATRGRGFWWWLFGTGSVIEANRESELRWQRMHERLKATRDRRRTGA